MTKSEARKLKLTRSLAEAHALADAVLSRARRAAARHAPSRRARTDKKAERNARMAEIRENVMERAGGVCELCGDRRATEAHHVIGAGLRRAKESVDTVLALCSRDHLALHQGKEIMLDLAYTYCRSAGMHDAAAALAKRLDKVIEARAARRSA